MKHLIILTPFNNNKCHIADADTGLPLCNRDIMCGIGGDIYDNNKHLLYQPFIEKYYCKTCLKIARNILK